MGSARRMHLLAYVYSESTERHQNYSSWTMDLLSVKLRFRVIYLMVT